MTLGNETGGPVPAGTPSWLKWALIASLAVNLVIVGGVVGNKVFGLRGHWRGDRGGEEFGIMGYARTLDADRRAVIRKIVKAERPDLRALREDISKARAEAGEMLVSEPFDKEKVRAAMTRIGEAEARLKAAGISAFLSTAEQLTPSERVGLLEWWKRRRPHHFRERPVDAEKDAPRGRPE